MYAWLCRHQDHNEHNEHNEIMNRAELPLEFFPIFIKCGLGKLMANIKFYSG